MKIVFASSNKGKVEELQILLQKFDLQIIPQKELNVQDIPETGLTFVENALIKARHACLETGLPAIADDSGLEVIALNGAPGIYSARYAGANASDKDNNDKLLENLKGVPVENRRARFYCVLVYLAHAQDPVPLICEGSWEGVILTDPIGENGFGYNPIFFDETFQASAAQMSLHEKNEISHRGKALKLLMEKFPKKII